MKRAYGLVLASESSPVLRTALKKAQQSWLKFRDDECEYEADEDDGGTCYSATLLFCKADLTEKRAENLKDLQPSENEN